MAAPQRPQSRAVADRGGIVHVARRSLSAGILAATSWNIGRLPPAVRIAEGATRRAPRKLGRVGLAGTFRFVRPTLPAGNRSSALRSIAITCHGQVARAQVRHIVVRGGRLCLPCPSIRPDSALAAAASRYCLARLLTRKKIAHCGCRLPAVDRSLEACNSCLDRHPEWHILPQTDQLLLQANGTWRT